MWIDLLITAFFAVELVRGWKAGALYQLGVIVLLVLSLGVAAACTGPVSDFVFEKAEEAGMLERLTGDLETDISAGVPPEESLSRMGLREELFAGDGGLLLDWQSLLEEAGRESQALLEAQTKTLARTLLEFLTRGVAFVLVFYLCFIILRLLLRALSSGVNKIPFLGGLNRTLGLLAGFLIALLLSGLLLGLLPAVPALEGPLEEACLDDLILESALYRQLLVQLLGKSI